MPYPYDLGHLDERQAFVLHQDDHLSLERRERGDLCPYLGCQLVVEQAL